MNVGKARFLKLLNKENFRRLGFDTVPHAADIKFLEGLPESFIPVEEIRALNPSAALEPRHWEVNRIVYPVVIGGRVRSSMTTALVNGNWKVVSYGQVPLTRTVMAARFKSLNAAELNSAPFQYRIVTIFGLNEQFIGAFPTDARRPFLLIPTRPRNGLAVGVPQDGRSMLMSLRPAALALRGSNGPT